MAVLVDSYSESNQSSQGSTATGYFGQSFTGNGGILKSCKWYLKKFGLPTGDLTATIYAHSGIYGTSSVRTGSALATADTMDISDLTTSYQLIEFIFSGAEKIVLTNGAYYVLCLAYADGDISNYLIDGTEATGGAGHGGNASSGGVPLDAIDSCFYVYSDDPTTTSTSTTSTSTTSTSTTSTSTSTTSTSSSSSTSTTTFPFKPDRMDIIKENISIGEVSMF